MTLYALDDHRPQLAESGDFWIAPCARLIGQVHVGEQVSIWFGAILRADAEPIVLGPGCNVQDGCIFHVDPGFPTTLGRDVTVGHGAIVHGCTIEDGSLIGMESVVMNGARIGAGSLIGARTLIPEGTEIPPGSLVMGQPGRVVKALPPERIAALRATAARYRAAMVRYRDGLRAL